MGHLAVLWGHYFSCGLRTAQTAISLIVLLVTYVVTIGMAVRRLHILLPFAALRRAGAAFAVGTGRRRPIQCGMHVAGNVEQIAQYQIAYS